MIREPFDGLVCDMDGVLYRGGASVPGAAEAVNRLRDLGVKILFCTNNSRSTVNDYVDRLDAMGIEAGPDDVLTSAVVVGEVLRERPSGTALVVGGPGLTKAVKEAGFELIGEGEPEPADLVVVGWTPELVYEDIRRAADAVRAGAAFIASNDDASFPAEGGLWPGAGSILAAVEVAAGRKAEVVGKPHPPMLDAAAARLGARRIAIVGDRPDTDLAGAGARGWLSVLVLSGVTTRDEARFLDPPPDVTLASIAELPGLLSTT